MTLASSESTRSSGVEKGARPGQEQGLGISVLLEDRNGTFPSAGVRNATRPTAGVPRATPTRPLAGIALGDGSLNSLLPLFLDQNFRAPVGSGIQLTERLLEFLKSAGPRSVDEHHPRTNAPASLRSRQLSDRNRSFPAGAIRQLSQIACRLVKSEAAYAHGIFDRLSPSSRYQG